MAFESNYPLVSKNLTVIFAAMKQQSEKYPDRPLMFKVIETPSVQSNRIGNKELELLTYAIMMNDIYLGYVQGPMDYNKIPINVEPNVMALESEKATLIELQKYSTSIPNDGLILLRKFYANMYGRQSDVISTRLFHPESIVMAIINEKPLESIWERSKNSIISMGMTNYPVAATLDATKLQQYMDRVPKGSLSNVINIKGDLWTISYNNARVNFEAGGIWDRNSNTFGTWSGFPLDGDFLYGINLAGMILGLCNEKLTGGWRQIFTNNHWEERLRYLCINASMNNYQYSYILDYLYK